MINEALKYQKKLKTSQNKSFCQIRNKDLALKNPYIQVNPLNSYEWIIIDCDYNVPYHKDLPIHPNYIVRNKDNGKGHLYFKIKAVHNNGFSSYKALEYYNAVRYGLTVLLNGDLAFTQTLSKNPLAIENWRVEHIHSNEYELGELAEYCELVPKYRLKAIKETKESAMLLGRNQTIFDCTRVEAYRMNEPTLEKILVLAESFNATLNNPLHAKEIGHIAKSIYRYVSKPKNLSEKEKLSERQKERGIKSGKKRKERSELNKANIIPLLYTNKSLRVIASIVGLSLSTIKRVATEFKNNIFDVKNIKVHEPYQIVPLCGYSQCISLNCSLCLSNMSTSCLSFRYSYWEFFP